MPLVGMILSLDSWRRSMCGSIVIRLITLIFLSDVGIDFDVIGLFGVGFLIPT